MYQFGRFRECNGFGVFDNVPVWAFLNVYSFVCLFGAFVGLWCFLECRGFGSFLRMYRFVRFLNVQVLVLSRMYCVWRFGNVLVWRCWESVSSGVFGNLLVLAILGIYKFLRCWNYGPR